METPLRRPSIFPLAAVSKCIVSYNGKKNTVDADICHADESPILLLKRVGRNSYPNSTPCSIATSPDIFENYSVTEKWRHTIEQMSLQKTTLRNALEEHQFRGIMKELRIISSQVKKEELMHDQRADWMYAAMVIDRVCFVSFSAFLILCTLVLAFKAQSTSVKPVFNSN
ncbi:unnamed protein product [Cylicocyclus nassatus]|uniref:Neurotransmitter-gated ion-channel transmembrane domain-containing protein n=1 Tax=Cylicocyclus nassatus TaxID=53992 RepID=A0AA36GLC0_CYLNA|nr:unnamed protein product [Cylicocyclus nassatus]